LERPLETHPAVLRAEAPGAIEKLPSDVMSSAGGGSWVTDPRDSEHRRLLRRAFQFEVVTKSIPLYATIGGRVLVRFHHGAQPVGISVTR